MASAHSGTVQWVSMDFHSVFPQSYDEALEKNNCLQVWKYGQTFYSESNSVRINAFGNA